MKMKLKEFGALVAMPVTIIATEYNGAVNFATHGQCMTVSATPPIIALSVIKTHTTAHNILQTGYFSVSIPSKKEVEKVRYGGSVSGKTVDKSTLFSTFYGKAPVPLVQSCPVNFSCRTVQTVDLHDVFVFFGEVIETFADKECMGIEWPDVKLVNPLICSLDGSFWAVEKEV